MQALITQELIRNIENKGRYALNNWEEIEVQKFSEEQKMLQIQMNLWLHEYKKKQAEERLVQNKQISKELNQGINKFQLFPRNPNFSGREEQLKMLYERFSSSKKINFMCVVGLGGTGKSQLVNEYVYRSVNEKKYQHVLWLHAEHDQIFSQIQGLVECWTGYKYEAKDELILIKKFYEYLGKQNTCIVIDNARDPNSIIKYLATKKLKNRLDILITSRYQEWGNVPVLKLENFSDKDTEIYMNKVMGKPCKDIEKFNKMLGGLALAIDQAASYIKQNRLEIADYCVRFEKESSLLLEQANDTNITVLTTVTLAIVDLRRINKTVELILSSCAYLSADDITINLLESLLKLPKETLAEPMNILAQYSLVSIKEDKIKLHRLTQSVIRFIHEKNKLFEQQYKYVFDWLSPQLEYNRKIRRGAKEIAHIVTIIPHAQQLGELSELFPLEQLDLYQKIGFHQIYEVSNHSIGKNCFEKVLELKKEHYGQDHPEIAITLNNLACSYDIRAGKANCIIRKELLEQALSINEKHYGQDHIEVAVNLTNLSGVFSSLGEFKKAKQLANEH